MPFLHRLYSDLHFFSLDIRLYNGIIYYGSVPKTRAMTKCLSEDPIFSWDPDPNLLKKKSDPAQDPTLIRNKKINIHILGR